MSSWSRFLECKSTGRHLGRTRTGKSFRRCPAGDMGAAQRGTEEKEDTIRAIGAPFPFPPVYSLPKQVPDLLGTDTFVNYSVNVTAMLNC